MSNSIRKISSSAVQQPQLQHARRNSADGAALTLELLRREGSDEEEEGAAMTGCESQGSCDEVGKEGGREGGGD